MLFNTEAEAIANLEAEGCDNFEGMSSCGDDCTGWDGESPRCDCGNRRIELITEQNADGKWFAYGSAY